MKMIHFPKRNNFRHLYIILGTRDASSACTSYNPEGFRNFTEISIHVDFITVSLFDIESLLLSISSAHHILVASA